MTMKGMNALYTDTKLLEKTVNFTDYVKLKDQKLFLRATKFNMDSVFIKISIFDKPDDIFAPDIMGHRQCLNRQFYIFKIANNLSLQLVNCLDFQHIRFQLLEIKFNVLNFKRTNNNC